MSKRPVTVLLDDTLEERLNNRRRVGLGRIRSFSDVTREVLIRGLDSLDREQLPASIANAPTFLAAARGTNDNNGGAPECA
ncbi:hypothetical protein WMF18_28955 [Sorangium sp. So ce315]|uniref:hypothetical protein n=1 Tax=Sorangium sp. So ce315 TaxID=3133299 RepID=UPI003F61BFD4